MNNCIINNYTIIYYYYYFVSEGIQGKDVGKCVEDQFLQRKCKDCRYQACLKAGMKKEYLQGAKPKKGQKLPKERELGANAYLQQDPGKDRLLQIAISFWR